MRPVDLVVAGYLTVAPLGLAGPSRPGLWPWLVAAHAAAVAVLLHLARHHPDGSVPGRPDFPVLRWIRRWYPILAIPFLYAELPLLNQSLGPGYFDAVIIGAEEAIFGTQPARTFAGALPWMPVSELLHASYLAYYPIIVVPVLALHLRGRWDGFAATVFAVMLTFFICYLFFIFLPVQGPRYQWPPPPGIPDGPVRALALFVLEGGSSRGAAFPSSHVAVAAIQAFVAFRVQPKAGPLLGVVAVALALGAIYGGFHYATDAVAGAAVAAVVVVVAPALYRRLGGSPSAFDGRIATGDSGV